MKIVYQLLLIFILCVSIVNAANFYTQSTEPSWKTATISGKESKLNVIVSNVKDKKADFCWYFKDGSVINPEDTLAKSLYYPNGSCIRDNKNKCIVGIKYETNKCNVDGVMKNGFHLSLTEAQAINIDKEFKLGNTSWTEVYQNDSMVIYGEDLFTVYATLYMWNGETWVIAPENIFITDTGVYKFGAEDLISKSTTKYKYVWQSTKEINFDGYHYYFEQHLANSYFYLNIYETDVLDLSDICIENANCTYSHNGNTLEVEFYGFYDSLQDRIFIDPSYVQTYSSSTNLIGTGIDYWRNQTQATTIGVNLYYYGNASIGYNFTTGSFNSMVYYNSSGTYWNTTLGIVTNNSITVDTTDLIVWYGFIDNPYAITNQIEIIDTSYGRVNNNSLWTSASGGNYYSSNLKYLGSAGSGTKWFWISVNATYGEGNYDIWTFRDVATNSVSNTITAYVTNTTDKYTFTPVIGTKSGGWSVMGSIYMNNNSNYTINLTDKSTAAAPQWDAIAIGKQGYTPTYTDYTGRYNLTNLYGSLRDNVYNIKSLSGKEAVRLNISVNNAYESTLTSASNFGGSKFSLCGFFKVDNIAANNGLFGITSYGSNDAINIEILGGILGFRINNAARVKYVGFGSNNWYHVCGTYNLTDAALYLNGVLVNISSYSTAVTRGSNARVVVGNEYDHSLGGIGWYSDIMMWNRSITATEVNNYYRLALGGNISNTNVTLQTRTANTYNITDSELVTFFTFNNDNSSHAFDELLRFNGTRLGGISNANELNGITGKGYYFDGTNDIIDVGNSSKFNFSTNPFSISFWTKTTDTAGIFLGKRNIPAAGDEGYIVYIASNSARFLTDDVATAGTFSTGTTVINDNKWHFITAVRDGTGTNIYIDSTLEDSDAGLKNINNMAPLLIGWQFGGDSATYISGSIDEVRIYNRSLTAPEIKNLYELGNYHITDWTEWENQGLIVDNENLCANVYVNSSFFQFRAYLNSNDTSVSPYVIKHTVQAASYCDSCNPRPNKNWLVRWEDNCTVDTKTRVANLTLNGTGIDGSFTLNAELITRGNYYKTIAPKYYMFNVTKPNGKVNVTH